MCTEDSICSHMEHPDLSLSPCAKDNAKQDHITACVDKYKKHPREEVQNVRLGVPFFFF